MVELRAAESAAAEGKADFLVDWVRSRRPGPAERSMTMRR